MKQHQTNPNMPGRWLTRRPADATTGRKLKGAALGLLLALSGPLGTAVLAQTTVNDLVHGYPAGVVSATFSLDTHNSTGYSIDLGTSGGGVVVVTNASFLNLASSNNVLAMSIWVREYGIAASSVLWGVSPSSSDGERGWNVHFPWSDDTIYFDTDGCCGANGATGQRISANITTFAPYVTVGDDSFWTNWHHLVALYNNTDKQIWIDGQLFLEGTSTNPLPTDFTNLYAGANSLSGNLMHAKIGDFAVYSTALSSNSIQLLYNGTSPTNLPGEKALAYWNFAPPEIGPLIGTYNGFTYTLYNTSTRVTDPATIALTLNGQAVTPTSLTTNGAILTLSYAVPNPPLLPGSTNTVSLALKDTKANSYSSAGSFVVQQFTLVPTNQLVAASAATTRGFYLQTYAVDAVSAGGTAAQSDAILVGAYGPNYAATSDSVAGNVGANGFFTWTSVINFDIAGGYDPVGDFQQPNYLKFNFPGIPSVLPGTSTNADTVNFVVQLYAALDFTSSGLYTMGVDSDDGFQVTLGLNPPFSVFGSSSTLLGAFDSTRAWADTDFQFYIQQPGLYPFRLLYWQVGGGASLEWFMVDPNGIKVLINDTTNSIAAYEWLPSSSTAYLEGVSPTPGTGGADTNLAVSAIIIDGTSSAVDTSTVKLQLDGTAVNATVSKTNGQTTVTYAASSPLAEGSQHSATLSYTAGTISTNFTWSFFIEGLVSRDVINKNIAVVSGTAVFTPNGGGHTGKAGDYGIDQGSGGFGWVTITNCSFLDLAASNQVLAMSMWLKKYDIANGSAFWADFGGTVGSRAWNVHFPWSDDNIYFDTDGCCTAGTQRINADINTFAPYNAVGNDGWWTNWHHLVAQYNQTDKQIWIDGQMFLEGTNTNPLPVEFDYLWLGRDAGSGPTGTTGGDVEHAVIDDFSVYSTALDATDIMALFNGTAPNAISAKASLLAWWPFDDPPSSSSTAPKPTIGIALVNGKLVITYTGTLLSSATVSGPYSPVTGATSPYTVPTPGGPHTFYRAQQ